MNQSPWSSVKSQSHEQRVGVTPRPSPIPAGAPRPWEGSVKGGRGSGRMEPSIFLSCVGGSDPVSASGSPMLPPRQLPGLTARTNVGIRASAAPGCGGAARHSDGHGQGLCSLTCAVQTPQPRDTVQERLPAKEGLCCRTEPVRQRLWGTHACWRVHGAVTVAEPTRGHGTAPTARFGARSRAKRRAGCKQCVDFAFSSTPGVFKYLFF